MSERDALIEAAATACRARTGAGLILPHPAWADLDGDGRRAAFHAAGRACFPGEYTRKVDRDRLDDFRVEITRRCREAAPQASTTHRGQPADLGHGRRTRWPERGTQAARLPRSAAQGRPSRPAVDSADPAYRAIDEIEQDTAELVSVEGVGKQGADDRGAPDRRPWLRQYARHRQCHARLRAAAHSTAEPEKLALWARSFSGAS